MASSILYIHMFFLGGGELINYHQVVMMTELPMVKPFPSKCFASFGHAFFSS
jgi:hypothetical protein